MTFYVIQCRQYSIDYKLETYLKIAQLYLEDEDPVQAEAYINRALILQADTKTEKLQILYKVTFKQKKFKFNSKLGGCEIPNQSYPVEVVAPLLVQENSYESHHK